MRLTKTLAVQPLVILCMCVLCGWRWWSLQIRAETSTIPQTVVRRDAGCCLLPYVAATRVAATTSFLVVKEVVPCKTYVGEDPNGARRDAGVKPVAAPPDSVRRDVGDVGHEESQHPKSGYTYQPCRYLVACHQDASTRRRAMDVGEEAPSQPAA